MIFLPWLSSGQRSSRAVFLDNLGTNLFICREVHSCVLHNSPINSNRMPRTSQITQFWRKFLGIRKAWTLSMVIISNLGFEAEWLLGSQLFLESLWSICRQRTEPTRLKSLYEFGSFKLSRVTSKVCPTWPLNYLSWTKSAGPSGRAV